MIRVVRYSVHWNPESFTYGAYRDNVNDLSLEEVLQLIQDLLELNKYDEEKNDNGYIIEYKERIDEIKIVKESVKEV
ncbi:MAG: hypothetical protein GF411_02975 [Candidatus Lokiarchaeota archaeon]|nr:hypothetical protein [Candidatus Lokiarchaeota archaeon]